MKDEKIQRGLSEIMLTGVFIAAAVMLAGGIYFLSRRAGMPAGDHVFQGEPTWLRHPVTIVKDALKGNDACIIQVGVLLLLANPFIRVFFAGLGFAAQGDRQYSVISLIVFVVLIVSFFW
jgi:uncharacterized membrane protein